MCSNNYIKNRKAFLLFSLVLFFSQCKKTSEHPVSYREMKVLETKTEKPLKNVSIILEKCSKYGFGCLEYVQIGQTYTDENGVFKFDNSLPVYRITATLEKYYDAVEESFGDIHLTPMAWFKAHVLKINEYPDNAILGIGSDAFYLNHFGYLPIDTIMYLDVAGNQENTIYWSVDTSNVSMTSGQTAPKYVNSFDTMNVEVKY